MVENKVKKLFQKLEEKKLSLATAESCTGGLLGGVITSVPGSSSYYTGGLIAYSNRIKITRLGIEKSLLSEYGAVSKEVAAGMGRGCQEFFDSAVALVTTGIAGPGGGTEEKPVGLVYTAVVSPEKIEVSENIFEGNRKEIRQKTVNTVLKLAADHLSSINNAK